MLEKWLGIGENHVRSAPQKSIDTYWKIKTDQQVGHNDFIIKEWIA